MIKTVLRNPLQIIACIALSLYISSCTGQNSGLTEDGLIVRPDAKPEQLVKLKVLTDRIINVSSVTGEEFPETRSLMAIGDTLPGVEFNVEENDSTYVLITSYLKAFVSKNTGEVWFTDQQNNLLLAEKKGGGKSFKEINPDGKASYAIRQQFESPPDEAIYGLGANQTSLMNLKGKNLDLYQYNTMTAVPFLMSNKNYGILWDNYSRTKFGDTRDYKNLGEMKLFNNKNEEGGLTAVYSYRNEKGRIFATREEEEIDYRFIPDLSKFPEGYDLNNGYVTWDGYIQSKTDGIHDFVFTSAGYARLWIDDSLVFDRWRQAWNPSYNNFYLVMDKDKEYHVRIEWTPDGGQSYIALRYLDPLPENEQGFISLYSEAADQIDYYFIAGDNMDEVISGYRTITGKAPVMPKWAMGFWQSRERYTSQEELLSVVREFRARKIPIDNIVQDWQYWPIDKWGSHDFDPERFPEPEAMIRTLHDSLNTNIMISVWPKYYTATDNYRFMNSKGWLYTRNVEKGQIDWIGYVSTFYDAFNEDAREEFWKQINKKLFSKGIDAWWLDATEPDISSNLPMDERKALMNPTALGPATEYFNAYALVNAQGVYEGQRQTDPDQRVFILTRSAYAGLQRYSAANWSGDIAARWHDFEAQIPCGLNFCMSGIPWWTMDIGGFAVEGRYYNPSPEDIDEWRELNTRWFQYGAFCPLFRSHGQYPYREMFNIAPETHPAFRTMLYFDKLRYRMMPYIYSLAGHTWLNDYTPMRGLVMDFTSDTRVHDIKDQYMFGPSLLVNPVYEYKARSREVYLPEKTGWYDFYTGEYYEGGQTIISPAPLDKMPLFARAGSIIPFGPEMQYSTEKKADPLILFVYAGADGSFTLYEDEGVNNDYENGAYSLITVTWNENDQTLTIGERQGEFPGMLRERTINLILVTREKAVKLDFDAVPGKIIQYDGEEITSQL
ncbi:MAG: glycoside hydrolase family 31 protein [Bacteroidales bacterium]|nr:glycoside hydrolase family 31 protein [Bacteroidales bacterium]